MSLCPYSHCGALEFVDLAMDLEILPLEVAHVIKTVY